MIYHFVLKLEYLEDNEIDDADRLDALFRAGSTEILFDQDLSELKYMDFTRIAESAKSAIDSAIRSCRRAGFHSNLYRILNCLTNEGIGAYR